DPVGRICIRVNRPAAKIERRHVSIEFGKIRSYDCPAPQTGRFYLLQNIFIERQKLHPKLERHITPRARPFIENGINLAAHDWADGGRSVRHAGVVANVDTPTK